ncbi:hypothetical protein ACQ4PT_026639 [Festuca glaucescens]
MGGLAGRAARIHLREASPATQHRPPRRQRRTGAPSRHAKMALGSAQPGQSSSTPTLGAEEDGRGRGCAFCSVLGAWASLELRLLLCKNTGLFKELLAKDCWKENSGIFLHWLHNILIAFAMASEQGHEQDNRSGHNIGDTSFQRCECCDAHYYWCHLDDTQKYFFKCMVGDFQEKMASPEKFVENFKSQISEVIKLEAPDGNIYEVQAIRDLNKIVLGSGWEKFAGFYELKEGCILVFRYSGDSHFRVLIFDYPSCCEKEIFHVIMNCGPNAQEKDTRLDQSLMSETRCHNGGSGKGNSRQRCGHCDVHFYWHHLDDRQKHFLRLMIGDFRREMSIPEKFVKNFRGRISEFIKLEAPDGNVYDIQVTKDLNKIVLGSRWTAFANAYKLKEYDLLVFRYIGDSHFKALIFEPTGCEKQIFRVVMKCAPNIQERGISYDQSFPGEIRHREDGLHCNSSRKTRKMTPLDSPSPRLAEGITSETMNSGGLRETNEPRYVLATGCNLTTVQKADVDALVNKIKPVIPFYITAIDKKCLSGSLVICKDYAAKHLPHDDEFITLCHPQKSTIWVDNLKVNTDGDCMLSAGWSCFVHHNELRESDICAFEVSKSNCEVTMVVHTLEGGHQLQGKEPESQNKCIYPVEGEETEEEESYKGKAEYNYYYSRSSQKPYQQGEKFEGGHQLQVEGEETEEEESYKGNAESNYYYSRSAKLLTSKEKTELFRSASIQVGNPVYVAILLKNHLGSKNNMMNIPRKFGAKHLAQRSHDILLLRPNRKAEWCVRYYCEMLYRGFTCRNWTKFVHDNKLRKGDVCVFELMKGVSKVIMIVHVFRNVDGRFVLLG